MLSEKERDELLEDLFAPIVRKHLDREAIIIRDWLDYEVGSTSGRHPLNRIAWLGDEFDVELDALGSLAGEEIKQLVGFWATTSWRGFALRYRLNKVTIEPATIWVSIEIEEGGD